MEVNSVFFSVARIMQTPKNASYYLFLSPSPQTLSLHKICMRNNASFYFYFFFALLPHRLLEMCTELTSTVTQLQDDLEALTHTNQLLLSKNKSLEEAMKANERKTVQHHLHQALSLSVHALCHGMMYSDFRLRNNTSRSVSEDAAGKLPSRHSPPTVSRNSSSPSLSLERKEVGGKGEGLLTGGECAEEMLPKYNPLKSGYLQWWMVDKGAIQVSVRILELVFSARNFEAQNLKPQRSQP